jgi:hypothetical protein
MSESREKMAIRKSYSPFSGKRGVDFLRLPAFLGRVEFGDPRF